LKQSKLVTDRAAGNRRLYQLNPEGFDSLREYFEQFWGEALQAFRRKVETQPTKENS
jgi:DNA-binding PadR family transcriptional regulator